VDIGIILLVASYAYFLSAIVRFVISRKKPSLEEERRKRLDKLYGRETGEST
jgi:hypothetical protein